MAFPAVFSGTVLHFKPLSASRPETNSTGQRLPTKITKARKQKSRNFRPPPPPKPPLSSAVEGGEATTFTRLPPRDDFGFDDLASQSVSEVIKLADIKAPAIKTKKINPKNGESKGFGSRIGVSEEKLSLDDEFDDEDEGIVKKVGYDYGRFELYEVGSDNDDDDDDDFDGEEGFMVSGDEEEDEEEEEEGLREKEKGVPAVMRCFDRAKIFVKAGDGGNGVVAFRREKFVPLGGPSGGDGGRGGNVYMKVEGTMNSLLPFRKSVHFRAGRGSHGQGQQKSGAKGEDLVVKVPPGTVVRESGGDVLFELLHPGQRALLLPGGRGGRGNASFKTGTCPRLQRMGKKGLKCRWSSRNLLVLFRSVNGVIQNSTRETLLRINIHCSVVVRVLNSIVEQKKFPVTPQHGKKQKKSSKHHVPDSNSGMLDRERTKSLLSAFL